MMGYQVMARIKESRFWNLKKYLFLDMGVDYKRLRCLLLLFLFRATPIGTQVYSWLYSGIRRPKVALGIEPNRLHVGQAPYIAVLSLQIFSTFFNMY